MSSLIDPSHQCLFRLASLLANGVRSTEPQVSFVRYPQPEYYAQDRSFTVPRRHVLNRVLLMLFASQLLGPLSRHLTYLVVACQSVPSMVRLQLVLCLVLSF